MTNQLKYGCALAASIIAGLIAANTVQPSTYSYCGFAVGSLNNCDIYYSSIDKEKTFLDQVQRGLIFGTATGVILFGGIQIFSKA